MRELAHSAWRWFLLVPPAEDIKVVPPDPAIMRLHREIQSELVGVKLVRQVDAPKAAP